MPKKFLFLTSSPDHNCFLIHNLRLMGREGGEGGREKDRERAKREREREKQKKKKREGERKKEKKR